MKNKMVFCFALVSGLSAIYSLSVLAKHIYPDDYGENVFAWYADVPETSKTNDVVQSRITMIGSGGIKVNARATQFSKYEVSIDGSELSSNTLKSIKIETDFDASPGTVYFAKKSAMCTLPSAVGLAGKEILVWNDCSNDGTITYKSTDNQTISGRSTISNSVAYTSDRFMSDGVNWLKE